MQLKKILSLFFATLILVGFIKMIPLVYGQAVPATATFDQSTYAPDASGNITTIVRVSATAQQFVRLYKIYLYFNTTDLTVTNITYNPAIGVVSSTLGGDDGSSANLALVNDRDPGEIRLLGENQTSTGASLNAGQNTEFARVTFHVNNTNQSNIFTGSTSGGGNNSTIKVIDQTTFELSDISVARAAAIVNSTSTSTCPYDNTQVKFRKADNTGSWTSTRTITANQSVRVGGFHNQSNTLATDITSISWVHVSTSATGTVDINGGEFSPPSDLPSGTYNFTAVTVGKTGASCTDTKPLTVNPPPAQIIYTTSFRVAESPTALSSAPWQAYTSHPMPYTHKLISPLNSGDARVIYVEFKSSDGRTQTFNKTFRYTPEPTITRLDCTHSPTGVGTAITIKGVNLGSQGDNGKVKVKGEEVDVTAWDETSGTITLTVGQRLEGRVAVAVTTNDNKTITKNCTINLTTVEFDTVTQCKVAGQFSASNVDVRVFERQVAGLTTPEPIQRQKISIDSAGKPQGFVPKFENGKNYTLLIKVPGALAKKVEFKAEGGTTILDPISFPVGDIAPSSAPDGKINAFDKSELIRQWSLARDVSKTGDFNLDSRINSLDYSCMVKNFNASDETYSPLTIVASPQPSLAPSPQATVSASPSATPQGGGGGTPFTGGQ